MRVGIGKQKMLNLRPKQFRPISLMQNMCNFQCILLFYDCAYSRLLSIYSLFFSRSVLVLVLCTVLWSLIMRVYRTRRRLLASQVMRTTFCSL